MGSATRIVLAAVPLRSKAPIRLLAMLPPPIKANRAGCGSVDTEFDIMEGVEGTGVNVSA